MKTTSVWTMEWLKNAIRLLSLGTIRFSAITTIYSLISRLEGNSKTEIKQCLNEGKLSSNLKQIKFK